MLNIKVIELVREDQIEESIAVMQARLVSDLYYMESLESDLEEDEQYVKLRDKAIRRLVTLWSNSPPASVPMDTLVYVKKLCAALHDCVPLDDIPLK